MTSQQAPETLGDNNSLPNYLWIGPMARRKALLDDLMEFGSKLPWRVAVLLAVGAFLAFHFLAITTSPPATGTTLGFGTVVPHEGIHTGALFLQYLAPVGLAIGALVAYFKQSRSTLLLSEARAKPTAISAMNWRDFERLIAEAFRRSGYKVTGFGGSRPDGGVDIGLVKNGERFLVQCKHWKTQQVGVTVVRELNGLVAALSAHGGFIVTGGQFTREAREFARITKIELINGDGLEELVGRVRSGNRTTVVEVKIAGQSARPCPKCGAGMVQREAKPGQHAGQSQTLLRRTPLRVPDQGK